MANESTNSRNQNKIQRDAEKNKNKPIDFQAYSYNFKVDWAGDFCMQSVAERRE